MHSEDSPYYTVFDIDHGVSSLEEWLADRRLSLGDVFVLLCGHLNSRISNIFPDAIGKDTIIMHEQSRNRRHKNVRTCSENMVFNAYGGKSIEYVHDCWHQLS